MHDFGARGDGTHDDTAALQAAFDRAAEQGDGVILLSPGVYRVRETLSFRADGCELLGVGHPTILAGDLLPRILDSDGRSRLRIAGVRVQGVGVQHVGGRGAIHLDEGSTDCTVENTEVRDAPGTGIVDDGDGNVVRGNRIERTGEHGIYVSGCGGGACTGNRIAGAGDVPDATLLPHGISVAGASHYTVRDNLVAGGRGLGVVLRDGAHDNAVTGNVVRATGDRLLLVGSGSRNLIAGNTLLDAPPGRDAVQITGGGGNRIQENFIHVTSGGGAAIRWVGADVAGGDLVRGNVILLDGPAVDYHVLELDGPRAAPARIAGNVMQAIRGAAPASSLHRSSGPPPHTSDNLLVREGDARTIAAGSHRAARTDLALRCDAARGAVFVTLPPAGPSRWRVLVIERRGAAGHPVIVRAANDDRIGGSRTLGVPPGRDKVYLQSTGAGWQPLA